MDKEKVYDIILQEQYPNIKDLRYNKKLGYLFSREELEQFKRLKDELVDENAERMYKLPLKSFNSKHIFFVNGLHVVSALNEYYHTLVDDYNDNKKLFYERHIGDMITSRIYSEIEGTLNIENVPTTHKRIKEVLNCDRLTDKNDIVIKNMSNAISFIVEENPKFNRENLFKLYNILSRDCLGEQERLNSGFYRNDKVYIGKYEGAPVDKIEGMMDSLFKFANDPENLKTFDDLLPHICHYYILYVHPYFDFNGRTARMVSFWLTYANEMFRSPLFLSEAINECKHEYYDALSNTRDMNNDLTYFLGYIFETSVKFSLVYKNVEEIEKQLNRAGEFLSSSEKTYLKKILIHNSDSYFNCKGFIDFINNNMSRQGAQKILNSLTDYGILNTIKNKKGDRVYKVNEEFITYKLN